MTDDAKRPAALERQNAAMRALIERRAEALAGCMEDSDESRKLEDIAEVLGDDD